MQPEDFRSLVQTRRSIRDFRPDPIPAETLEAILEDARECPSWSNTRPYCIAVASGEQANRLREAYLSSFEASKGLRNKDLKVAGKTLLSGGYPDGDYKTWGRYPPGLQERAKKIGAALYQHLGISRTDKEARLAQERRNCEFFGAPTVMLVYVHSGLLPFSAQDAGLMLQTLVLAAQVRGVSSCPLGMLATWRGPGDAEFEIPKEYRLITGLALGYASDSSTNNFRAEHPPVARVPNRRDSDH